MAASAEGRGHGQRAVHTYANIYQKTQNIRQHAREKPEKLCMVGGEVAPYPSVLNLKIIYLLRNLDSVSNNDNKRASVCHKLPAQKNL